MSKESKAIDINIWDMRFRKFKEVISKSKNIIISLR
jgi:hypothetical protein